MSRRVLTLLAVLVGVGCGDPDVTWGVAAEGSPGAGEQAEVAPPAERSLDPADGFATIAAVLQSPRCMNCHPADPQPLQTDRAVPHAMNISRLSDESGLECGACHQDQNAEQVGVRGGPPGAPHWGLPPASTPMVFQGHSPESLCRQLRDAGRNGGKSLEDLLDHVAHDPLVLWGWAPGGDRSLPPISHAAFVAAVGEWVRAGGACPGDVRASPPPDQP
ncbi:putative Isoquinoline 1-oxidoreductase subunit protein [Enhygromyxa salina]|uniref:Putative Isoquinoline 1-oxidoreductase subunit protein n=1 Tax=Enhygromyxa salina TaxID=215803 RepID=A0A0C2CQS7_9BACT|nr:hypothetical protein [Enhygromyxa salina]KIG13541.1 putative Isoquinoline 1-oxidoreductase subunit protein [Enhygromyxa salina]